MLERMQKYAIKIKWLRAPVVCLSLLALFFVAYLTINSGGSVNLAGVNSDGLLIPAVLLFCWGILAYSFINIFQAEPPIVNPQNNFFRRQVSKFRRLIRKIIALAFLALSLALVIVSFKLVTTGVG